MTSGKKTQGQSLEVESKAFSQSGADFTIKISYLEDNPPTWDEVKTAVRDLKPLFKNTSR